MPNWWPRRAVNKSLPRKKCCALWWFKYQFVDTYFFPGGAHFALFLLHNSYWTFTTDGHKLISRMPENMPWNWNTFLHLPIMDFRKQLKQVWKSLECLFQRILSQFWKKKSFRLKSFRLKCKKSNLIKATVFSQNLGLELFLTLFQLVQNTKVFLRGAV